MTEILNLSSLCRCCHAVGDFNSLEILCWMKNISKSYHSMLDEAFGLKLDSPLHLICDKCIIRLCDAYLFKCQVLSCEKKFEEYCRNKASFEPPLVEIKTELEDFHDDDVKLEDCNDIKVENNQNESGIDCNEYMDPYLCIRNVERKCDENDVKKENKRELIKQTTRKGKKVQSRKKYANLPTMQQRFEQSFQMMIKSEDWPTYYTCKLCTGHYKDLSDMRQHVINEHSKYDCTVCRKTCNNLRNWGMHVKTHTERKQHTCASCNENIEGNDDAHYKCDLCNTSFKWKKSIIVHIKKHMGTHKVVYCDTCGKQFYDISNMRVHQQSVHEALKPYACTYCDKRYGTFRSCSRHMERHCREKEGSVMYTCDLCPKVPVKRRLDDYSVLAKLISTCILIGVLHRLGFIPTMAFLNGAS